MENKNSISKKQQLILSLHDDGMSFHEIAEKVGITEKLAKVNYYYAVQKLNGEIPNKDTELTDEQKKSIKIALDVLSENLRELKLLDLQSKDELSYNPNDLINICQEMADKIGVPFNRDEFI